MPLLVRLWDCSSCGTMDIDRDLNAALNTRDKGILELKAALDGRFHLWKLRKFRGYRATANERSSIT